MQAQALIYALPPLSGEAQRRLAEEFGVHLFTADGVLYGTVVVGQSQDDGSAEHAAASGRTWGPSGDRVGAHEAALNDCWHPAIDAGIDIPFQLLVEPGDPTELTAMRIALASADGGTDRGASYWHPFARPPTYSAQENALREAVRVLVRATGQPPIWESRLPQVAAAVLHSVAEQTIGPLRALGPDQRNEAVRRVHAVLDRASAAAPMAR